MSFLVSRLILQFSFFKNDEMQYNFYQTNHVKK